MLDRFNQQRDFFQNMLREKYRQSDVATNAQAAANLASANKNNADAGQVAGLAQAQIAKDTAAAGFDSARTPYVGRLAESTLATNALANQKAQAELPFAGAQAAAGVDLTKSQAFGNYAQGSRAFGDERRATAGENVPLMFGVGNLDNLSLNDMMSTRQQDDDKGLFKFKRGTARVPGKGAGDKVPAMLEPGEAVLNKKAAGMIGRDKIAKANAKGNQQRANEAKSKVAMFLKKMGMV